MSGIPPLSSSSSSSSRGGGGGGGLTDLHRQLHRSVERWLSANRAALGSNQHIKVTCPVPTVRGISCRVDGVLRGGLDLIHLFKGYDPECSDVRETVNDETGERQYRVDIPFPRDSHRMDQVMRESPSSQGWFWRLANDPRFVLGGFMATATLASLTTHGHQWSGVLSVVLAGHV